MYLFQELSESLLKEALAYSLPSTVYVLVLGWFQLAPTMEFLRNRSLMQPYGSDLLAKKARRLYNPDNDGLPYGSRNGRSLRIC
jgi:hypothetical protein